MAYPILTVDHVKVRYPRQTHPAVDGVSLSLEEGNILALLGPSGCGKTTLLRLIAGFEQPEIGTITIGETVVATSQSIVPPEQRHIGMVFQDYALFPHLKVEENIGFGLKGTRADMDRRVAAALKQVGLEAWRHSYPHQLSGGQQQRVALARALVTQPVLVLLDEPLSNIDVQLRITLRQELRDILRASKTSAIWVTHDQEEAMAIADWIGVMSAGKLEQWGTPEEVYRFPKTPFVASFVTQANFLPIFVQDTVFLTEIGTFPINGYKKTDLEGKQLMVRQEDLQLLPDDNSGIVIYDRAFLGKEWLYHLLTPSEKKITARISCHQAPLPIGTPVAIQVIGNGWQLL